MRIAVFMNDLNSGGAEKIMVEYINYLNSGGRDEVVLILARKKGPYISLVENNVKVVFLNQDKIYLSILPLYKYLKLNRVDAIYSTLIKANIISLLVGKMLGIKVIIRIANTIKEVRKSQKSITDTVSNSLAKYTYSFAHKCIAISHVVKRDLVKYTTLSEHKIEVIYNPIIIIDTIEELYLNPEYFHVAFVSRLTKQKNIATAAKIIERFLVSPHKMKFHFFGEGIDRDILEALISKAGNTSIIELHGFEISYYSYIKQMQLFIHLPFWEGLGNSVLEVYNSGIPMILSNVETGYSELIKATYPNIHYVHPTEDVDKITDLIKSYMDKKIPIVQNREKLFLTKDLTYKSYRKLVQI